MQISGNVQTAAYNTSDIVRRSRKFSKPRESYRSELSWLPISKQLENWNYESYGSATMRSLKIKHILRFRNGTQISAAFNRTIQGSFTCIETK